MKKAIVMISVILIATSCQKRSQRPECYLTPEPDVCNAIGPDGWYFNQDKGKCIKYGTGGCTDVIFTTKAECHKCRFDEGPSY